MPGFVTAVAVFTLAQAILTPFILKITRKYAPTLLTLVGLITTFLALWIAWLFPDGLAIAGIGTWALATLIVWLVSALGIWILALIFLRNRRGADKTAKQ